MQLSFMKRGGRNYSTKWNNKTSRSVRRLDDSETYPTATSLTLACIGSIRRTSTKMIAGTRDVPGSKI